MDGRYVNSKISTRKAQKLKSFNGDISPLNPNSHSPNLFRRDIGHRRPKSPIFDPYASSSDGCSVSSDIDSPLALFMYLNSSSSGGSRSRSRNGSEGRNGGGHLSPFSLASIQDFETPSKALNVEEDVLVMDGILVDNDKINNSKSSSSARSRSTLTSSGSRGRAGLFTVFPDGNRTNFYEREKRVLWEDSGTPPLDSRSYIGQENEELHSIHPLSKNKSEEKLCKAFISGSCTYGARCRFVHQLVSIFSIDPASTAKALPRTAATISPITYKKATTTTDWSPLDDGIEIALPSASSKKTPLREDVDAHIHAVLYGPSVRKRLPVFTKICPH